MTRLKLTLLLIVLALWPGTALATEWTPGDTLAALEQYAEEFEVSYWWLYRIVGCETGWTFRNDLVGRAGELGAVQLHPRGELPRFYAWGYDDPYSPYQSIRFLSQRLTMGGARAWSCR